MANLDVVRARDMSWWRRHQLRLTPILLLAPALLFFLVFVIYPIGASLWLSLHAWDGVGPRTWVGFDNYRELFGDPVFATALRNNLIWLVLNFAAPIGGLALALLLNQRMFGIRVVRSLFFMPFVISQAIVGIVFAWFFNPDFGLFQKILTWLELAPAAPLESERWAIIAVVLVGLWPQTAYCLILYLTGLATLNVSSIEAARVVGARGLSLLWHVVIPQLRPITFVAAMVCVVSALRSFDLVMVMTGGGPYDSSTVLAYYMYEQTFLSSRYGYAAAIACTLFLMMCVCVGIFLWQLLRRERS